MREPGDQDDDLDEPQPGNIREATDGVSPYGGPFARLLGIQFEHVAAGRSRLRMQVRPDFLNSRGTLHGGVLSSLVDLAIGMAIRGDERGGGPRRATVDLNVTFLRPIRQGLVAVEGWVLRRGRTMASGEAEVFNDRGELLAKGRATFVAVGEEGDEPAD